MAAIIAGVGGVLLAVRAVRNKERMSAKEDMNTVTSMLADERKLRIEAEQRSYRLMLLLAQHGIDVPDA